MLEQETTRAFAEVPKALSPAATPLVRVALDRTSSPQRQAGNRSHTHQVLLLWSCLMLPVPLPNTACFLLMRKAECYGRGNNIP